jgi:hypothetical protein
MKRALPLGLALALALRVSEVAAGPPYVTDDPEPVERSHWELYLASQTSKSADGWSATLPHVEVNFGAATDLQLHVIAPLALSAPTGEPRKYGYGDTELGAKLRFVHESEHLPQIGTFPLLEVPTGTRDLGSGGAQVLLPIWLQKSIGAWTTYGGAGYWIRRGPGQRNGWLFGWQVQRRLVSELALGVEIVHLSPSSEDGAPETRFNLGAVIDLGELHHILASGGRTLFGPTGYQSYLAYQLTFGS